MGEKAAARGREEFDGMINDKGGDLKGEIVTAPQENGRYVLILLKKP